MGSCTQRNQQWPPGFGPEQTIMPFTELEKNLRRMRHGGLPGYNPSKESFSSSMGSTQNAKDRSSKVGAEDWVGQMLGTGHLDKSSFSGVLETEVWLEYNSCS